jgi:hypothetical protein
MRNLIGKEAKVPGGQRVKIESVKNSIATVRRIDGKFKGRIAVIAVEKLKLT